MFIYYLLMLVFVVENVLGTNFTITETKKGTAILPSQTPPAACRPDLPDNCIWRIHLALLTQQDPLWISVAPNNCTDFRSPGGETLLLKDAVGYMFPRQSFSDTGEASCILYPYVSCPSLQGGLIEYILTELKSAGLPWTGSKAPSSWREWIE